MEWLVWIGAVITLAGVGVLMGCIRSALRMRKGELPEDQIQAKLQGLAAWNMGGLGMSAVGLTMVVVGLTLS